MSPASQPSEAAKSQPEPIRADDPRAEEIKGVTEPRLWTRPLRELTPETSAGFAAIIFAEEYLGLRLMPWQKWLLIHALELKEDGSLRFRTLLILISRQNGKSLIVQLICLYMLLARDSRLVLGTAQNLEVAREIWESAIDLLENSELADCIEDVKTGNGKELLKVKVANDNGEIIHRGRWKIGAANRKGGRGHSADVVVMDELREQQNWEAWNAVTKTTMARADALILGASNAGDVTSVVLSEMREKAIEKIDSGESLFIAEWSAPEDADIDDVNVWAQANPSLGYTISLKALVDARMGPENGFRTENLCQWVKVMEESFINPDQWALLTDHNSQIPPEHDLAVAVDVSADRAWTSVAVAGKNEEGKDHVEVIAYREGMFWVVDYVAQILQAQALDEVVVQGRGCAASELILLFQKEGINVRTIQGSELGFATGQFKDKVRDRKLVHLGQPVLSTAVEGSMTKTLGEAQAWDRHKSLTDVSPLVAASWALFALNNKPLEEEPQISAYSTMEERYYEQARARTSAALAESQKNNDWWL